MQFIRIKQKKLFYKGESFNHFINDYLDKMGLIFIQAPTSNIQFMNVTLRKPVVISNQRKRRNTTSTIVDKFNEGAVLLDVRTIQEFDRSKISGARHISYDLLPIFIAQVKNWNTPVIVYSTYGERSRLASTLLGKENVEVLDGGSKIALERLLFQK